MSDVVSISGTAVHADAVEPCSSIELESAIADVRDMIRLGVLAAGNDDQRLACFALQEAADKIEVLWKKYNGEGAASTDSEM